MSLMPWQTGKALLEGMLPWSTHGIKAVVLPWSSRQCLEKGSVSSLHEQHPG